MPASPAPEWIAASVAKRGNQPGENEDATAAAPDELRFAVCDGATEGWESGPWAARLAAAFVARPPEPADFPGWLASARDWAPDALEGTQPWYVAEKREQGSFATLLGLELRRSQNGEGWSWRAVAVGDSCLFHLRGTELAQAFPLESAAAFGNRPALSRAGVGRRAGQLRRSPAAGDRRGGGPPLRPGGPGRGRQGGECGAGGARPGGAGRVVQGCPRFGQRRRDGGGDSAAVSRDVIAGVCNAGHPSLTRRADTFRLVKSEPARTSARR
jgi:hypothetical protein